MQDALVRQGVDRLDAALAVLDAQGTVVYTNNRWESEDTPGTVPAAVSVDGVWGLDGEALADETAAERVHGAVDALLTGEADERTVSYARPRFEERPRRFRLRGRRFTAGDDPHALLTHTETTSKHRVAAEREHYSEVLADVATVVSHDIRSPLTAALSWVELLEADPDSDTEKVERVRSSLERMNAMADAAVTLARETAVDEVEPVDVGRVASQVWGRVDTTGAELSVTAVEPVLADEHTVEVLFEHLLQNAVDHGLDGTDREHLTVRVGPLANGFYVEDDGVGVETALVDSAFDPGVTTSPADNNTGIGLAIVERAAEAHGWTVDLVESNGARFEITGVDEPSPPAGD